MSHDSRFEILQSREQDDVCNDFFVFGVDD